MAGSADAGVETGSRATLIDTTSGGSMAETGSRGAMIDTGSGGAVVGTGQRSADVSFLLLSCPKLRQEVAGAP